jgi:hypothetical protein
MDDVIATYPGLVWGELLKRASDDVTILALIWSKSACGQTFYTHIDDVGNLTNLVVP